MKMGTLMVLCGLTALVTGAPTNADTIVSETELFQVEVDAGNKFDAHAVAKSAIVELLQTGKDEDACKELANASISQVEESVKAEQKIIDELPDGSHCLSVDQEAVEGAQKAVEEATKAKTDADAALEAAQAAPVTFRPVPYDSLSEGKCDALFSDPAYTEAVGALNSAESEAEKANGAVDMAQKALKAAKDAQTKAIKECECGVRADYDKVWAAASASIDDDANKKTYTQGKHMLCILDHVTSDKCDVGAVPTVNPRTLADNVPPSGDPSCTPAAAPAPPVIELSSGKTTTSSAIYTESGMGTYTVASNALLPDTSCTWGPPPLNVPQVALGPGNDRFWQVDLEATRVITEVKLRATTLAAKYTNNVQTKVCSDSGGSSCTVCGQLSPASDQWASTSCPSGTTGQYVRLLGGSVTGQNWHFCRVAVDGY